MILSVILAGLWAASTVLISVGPNRYHWPVAWALIGIGVPLVGWITFQNGPLFGLLALAGGVSALRLPVRGLMRSARPVFQD